MRLLKKAGGEISTILLIFILATAILLAAGKWTGLGVYAVLSGSMEPTYHVGSLILVKEVAAKELQTGDAITFLAAENTVVTHRITQVVSDSSEEALCFRTRGDANDAEDAGLVHENNVIGKPFLSIPVLGYLIYFIQHPPGTYIMTAICAALFLISFIFKRKRAD